MPWLTALRRVILPILLAAAVRAQCPNSIVAGPPSTYAGDGQPAISAWLFQPSALTLDAAGNLYIADSGNNRIRKVTTDGVIHTVAGPDGLNNPQFVLAAPDGSVYIADSGNNRISQLTPSGTVNIIAGTGHPGYSGDNGAAAGAELNYPTGMALDSKGNLYFADTYNSAVRRIDTKGVITTVPAGNQNYALYTPQAVAIAADGSILIADPGDRMIFRVAPDGAFSTFAPEIYLDGSPATNLTVLSDGSVLIADGDLMELSADGSTLSYYARAISATNVALGPSGIYYISAGNVIFRAATAASEPALFAGQYYSGNAPDNVPAFGPIFGAIGGMVVGPDGSIWLGDTQYGKIRRILPGGTQKVVATGPTEALALDSAGNLYAGGGSVVFKIAPGGSPSLFAGGGSELIPALGAPAMPATAVNLSSVEGVVTDLTGNVYVLSEADGYLPQGLIARIAPGGELTTIFDSTKLADAGGVFWSALGLAVDSTGYLLVPLYAGGQILRIATDGSGIFQTLTAPDSIAAAAASPSGEIFYVTDATRIKALKAGATLYNRDISPTPVVVVGLSTSSTTSSTASSLISTLLTTPRPGGEPAGIFLSARYTLATDASGNLFYADPAVNAIRRFPVGACFTARAPQLSAGSPVEPITPQPSTATSTTATTTSTGTTTSTATTGTGLPATSQLIFAPGELIGIFGSGLGPQTGVSGQAGSNGLIATQLAGTQVLIEGVPAPVLYTSDGRVDTVIPFSLYGYPQLLVQVEYNGVLSDAVALTMYQAAPIVFTSSATGQPVAIVINQDGSTNSQSNPAAPGSIITFYGSGFGLTTPAGIDGHLATVPLPQPALPVSAMVDGWPATVLYAGDASGMVEGIVQMNIRLPQDLYYGYVNVTVGNNGMSFNINVTGN